MKKLILSILLLLSVGLGITTTKHSHNTKILHPNKLSNPPSFVDENSQSWLGRFENPDNCGNLLEFHVQIWEDSEWVNDLKYTYNTYDENNNPIKSVVYGWIPITSQNGLWYPVVEFTQLFDENNNLIQFEIISTGNILRSTYTYGETEDYDYISELRQEQVGTDWINDAKFIYKLNEDNSLDHVAGLNWENSEWVIVSSQLYSYGDNNNVDTLITHNFNNIDSLQTIDMNSYIYDENNNEIESLTQSLDFGDTVFVNFSRDTNYIYEVCDELPIGDESQNECWHLLGYTTQSWNNSEWVNVSKNTNYIYEVCGGLSINKALTPQQYSINSIYPNPFNPTTTISFSIPEFGLTTITAYDITGRELETLTNEVLSIGNYSINWNASSYPSGVYLIRMESGDFTQTQKVVLVK